MLCSYIIGVCLFLTYTLKILIDLSGKVEDGLGRKTGDMLQYISQTLSAFVVAFYFSWSLTLVLLCTLPFIAISGAYMINAITAATVIINITYL